MDPPDFVSDRVVNAHETRLHHEFGLLPTTRSRSYRAQEGSVGPRKGIKRKVWRDEVRGDYRGVGLGA